MIKVIANGYLGKDPEVKTSGAGNFTVCSLAVDRARGKSKNGEKEEPIWLNLTVFGKAGEFVGKYLKKGAHVLVTGTLDVETYEKKDKTIGTSVKILSSEVEALDRKSDGAPKAQATGATATAAAAGGTDEDIPF
jgi:single-strand DNA-binding protein